MKPKKPYKNIAEYGKSINPNKERPCRHCGGIGKVRNIEDLDPIEGYKLAPWYKCECCSDGELSAREFKDRYNDIIEVYRIELEHYNSRKDKILAILEVLNKSEKEDLMEVCPSIKEMIE